MYANGQCKKWRHIVNKFKDAYRKSNTEHIKQMQAKHNHFLSDTTKPNLHALYDTFIAVYAHGMPLPSGLKPADIVELEIHAQNLWFEVYRKNQEAVRLSIGRFVNELKHKMDKRVNGESEVKIAVYAGHDSTIAPLLGAFDVNDGKWPPFAANIVFELFENESHKHFVRVKYNGQPVHVPHCRAAGKYHDKDKSLCTVEAFFELMNRSIPKDFDKECVLEKE
jgi:acid phosphatase